MRRKLLPVLVGAALVLAATAGCGIQKVFEPTSAGGDSASGDSGGAKGSGNNLFHNDKFPCLANQDEAAAILGSTVYSDEIEPSGRTCIYLMSDGSLALTVFDRVDRQVWRGVSKPSSPWVEGDDWGGKAVAGVGDEAYVSQLPGLAGRLQLIKGTRAVQVDLDLRRRMTAAEVDKLAGFGKTVAARL